MNGKPGTEKRAAEKPFLPLQPLLLFFSFRINLFKVVEAPDLKAGNLKARAAFRGRNLGRQSNFWNVLDLSYP